MEKYRLDRTSLERDCSLEFIIAGGPGGQHRNKVESGVRLIHRPSGISVMATERRSQHANREVAFARMVARLAERQREIVPRRATRPTLQSVKRKQIAKMRASQIKRQRASLAENHD